MMDFPSIVIMWSAWNFLPATTIVTVGRLLVRDMAYSNRIRSSSLSNGS
jgi:hypothetical protein